VAQCVPYACRTLSTVIVIGSAYAAPPETALARHRHRDGPRLLFMIFAPLPTGHPQPPSTLRFPASTSARVLFFGQTAHLLKAGADSRIGADDPGQLVRTGRRWAAPLQLMNPFPWLLHTHAALWSGDLERLSSKYRCYHLAECRVLMSAPRRSRSASLPYWRTQLPWPLRLLSQGSAAEAFIYLPR
jgi:hypothetical protein